MSERLYQLTKDDISDILSSSAELLTLSEHVQDADLDRAMMYIAKLIEDPTLDPTSAQWAIVQLEAIAAKFGLSSVLYKTYEKRGTTERYKKDVYYTARDALRHLVDALKYIIRTREAN